MYKGYYKNPEDNKTPRIVYERSLDLYIYMVGDNTKMVGCGKTPLEAYGDYCFKLSLQGLLSETNPKPVL